MRLVAVLYLCLYALLILFLVACQPTTDRYRTRYATGQKMTARDGMTGVVQDHIRFQDTTAYVLRMDPGLRYPFDGTVMVYLESELIPALGDGGM